jgi:3-deoxy-D-manno-octulosonic-acid transferase
MAQQALLILVPRHPERFARVGRLCEEQGFTLALRSEQQSTATKDILLGDTMGELMLLFGASDIAFMGGSLVPNGGHNFIEPAAWKLPLVSGEHLFNFAEVSRLLVDAGALAIVQNADSLATEILSLIADDNLRNTRGQAALTVANDNRGALQKTLVLIRGFLQRIV